MGDDDVALADAEAVVFIVLNWDTKLLAKLRKVVNDGGSGVDRCLDRALRLSSAFLVLF